jgi:hypothetical protein
LFLAIAFERTGEIERLIAQTLIHIGHDAKLLTEGASFFFGFVVCFVYSLSKVLYAVAQRIEDALEL